MAVRQAPDRTGAACASSEIPRHVYLYARPSHQGRPFGIIPFFGKGVRIFHRVAGYPDKIVFWYLCANVRPLVAKIEACGYGT